MKLNNVIVVFKHSVTGTSSRQTRHTQCLSGIKAVLKKNTINHVFVDRDELKENLKGDLIITIGGDGTVLAAAHCAQNIPILGINSTPGNSVGFLCKAALNSFEKVINDVQEGKIKPRELPLIESFIDGKKLPHKALNDVLFAGTSPAETVHYKISSGGKTETHKSSGIWIASGPGSTAAIHSAGGKKIPIDSNELSFLVREPYFINGNPLEITSGVITETSNFEIISEITNGMIYIDGHHISYPAPEGASIKVKMSKETIKLFV